MENIEKESAKLVKRESKVISRVKVNNGGGILFELMQLSPETLSNLQTGESQR